MRRSLIPLALSLAAFATPAFSQSANLSNPAALREQAPPTYKARFDTSKGVFVIEVTRDWAPNGADRFYNLVKNGFYDDTRFFRVISGFMVQFGINGDPKLSPAWRAARIPPRRRNFRIAMDAELHHEARDHAEEADVVVKSVLHQIVETVGAVRGPVAVHLDHEDALGGVELGLVDGRRLLAERRGIGEVLGGGRHGERGNSECGHKRNKQATDDHVSPRWG